MDPFVGQMMLVGFNFAPVGYQIAAGQILPISSNTALFSLLGTYYGGDGRSNFALPNMQGKVAVGMGQGTGLSPYGIGQTGGVPSVSLTSQQLPPHTHSVLTGGRGDKAAPAGGTIADSGSSLYATTPPTTSMAPAAIANLQGGNQPHNNLMPYLALNWIIATQGVYPQRS